MLEASKAKLDELIKRIGSKLDKIEFDTIRQILDDEDRAEAAKAAQAAEPAREDGERV